MSGASAGSIRWLKRHIKRSLVRTQRLVESAYLACCGRPTASSAVVLAGSGRSGTTWLMDILAGARGMQPVFEPLNPEWSLEVARVARDRLVHAQYLRADRDHADWDALLGSVLTGRVRSFDSDYERVTCFPKRFVVKVIRANLMLGHIFEVFRPRIVFMMRHPCATVASRLALGWHADVRGILLQEELVEDYLLPWVEDIERATDTLEAHAVWWAVENMVANCELATRPHCFVTYEELCLRPCASAGRVFCWLDLPISSRLETLVSRPSRQSRQGVSYESTVGRLSSWQKWLTVAQRSKILDWAYRMGITRYDEHAVPASLRDGMNGMAD